MPLRVNLHHLERHEVVLAGELPLAELDIETLDALIEVGGPLRYNVSVEKLEQQLLVRGELELVLQCQCVRCLKSFAHVLRLADWVAYVPLAGEDAAAVEADCVDLTPYVREDILLAFPQHPLCAPECPGLTAAGLEKANTQRGEGPLASSSAWAELDKLKL
jgi:uncharacterized protein